MLRRSGRQRPLKSGARTHIHASNRTTHFVIMRRTTGKVVSMTHKFEYVSPREFQKLGKADKDRYLLALYRHLHTEYMTQEDIDF